MLPSENTLANHFEADSVYHSCICTLPSRQNRAVETNVSKPANTRIDRVHYSGKRDVRDDLLLLHLHPKPDSIFCSTFCNLLQESRPYPQHLVVRLLRYTMLSVKMRFAFALIFALSLTVSAAPAPQATSTCTEEAAATTTSAAPTTRPTAPYGVMSIRSGSSVHLLPMQARGQNFYLGGSPATYCPQAPVTECPSGLDTVFAGLGALVRLPLLPWPGPNSDRWTGCIRSRWSTHLHSQRWQSWLHAGSLVIISYGSQYRWRSQLRQV